MVGEQSGLIVAPLRAEMGNESNPGTRLEVEEVDALETAGELIHRMIDGGDDYAMIVVDLPDPPQITLLSTLREWWNHCPELQVVLITNPDETTWPGWLREARKWQRPLLLLGRPCGETELVLATGMLARQVRRAHESESRESRMAAQLAEQRAETAKLRDQLHEEMAARQQVIAERLELERLLLESQKLDSLGTVASGIAHDFNNLLTAILANASLLRELPLLTAEANENLDHIHSAAMTASGLCQQMLAYAGKGTRVLGEVDLNQLVQETVDLLRSVISKKARLHVSLSAEHLLVNADATQLKQVIMNLVANASDALGDKPGDIQVTTMRETHAGTDLMRTYRTPNLADGDYIHVVISDTGCGMTPEVLARAFDPFFSTKFIGRGLGLSAVRGIVRGHHGALRVDSAPQEGSTFHLLIPCLPATSKPVAPPVEVPKELKGRILIADDEALVRSSAQKILNREGYLTVLVENGRQVLDMLGGNMEFFDLVLLDHSMPELNGVETLVEMRRLGFRMPVILMSGYNTSTLGEGLEEAKPLDFLPKPFGLAQLREKVAASLARAGVAEMAGCA